MRLTKATLSRLKLPADKDELLVFDEELRGFGLRLRAGGKRTWIVQYRMGDKQRRLSLGPVEAIDADEARRRAKKALGNVAHGVDPKTVKDAAVAQAAAILGDLFRSYIDERKLDTKRPLAATSLNDLSRYLLVDWKPVHSIGVNLLERAAVKDRLVHLAKHNGVYASNRARAALSGFYTWAIDAGRAFQNPVAATKPFDEASRERTLSDAEVRLIWAHRGESDFGDILRLLILTGQRREEVAAIRWSEIDFGSATWSIPAERAKNRRATDVPLPAAAIEILRTRPRAEDRDLVFGMGEGGFQGWSRALEAMDKRIQKATGRALPEWRPHDIRRTVATGLQKLGVRFEVTEAILNHKSGKSQTGVAAVYQRHEWAQEKRVALDRWAAEVVKIVEGRATPSNVFALSANVA